MSTFTHFAFAWLLMAYAAGLLWVAGSRQEVLLTARDLKHSAALCAAFGVWSLAAGVFG